MKKTNVVIVGRTNVGKSTLFNKLSVNVKSLALDYEGVTRDFIEDEVCWKDSCFNLVDTGGVSFKKSSDPLLEKIRKIAESRIEKAALVVFVCDGTVGILPEDKTIAKMLHKLNKNVIVIINKIDNKQTQEHIHEFNKLGFKNIIGISAEHGTAIGDLLDTIVEELPAQETMKEEEKPSYKIVLLGKPNVGKSSLLNLITKKNRAIVADMPGTTREPLKETISFYKEDIHLVDTPGIRRKRAVSEKIETMMVKSAFRALEDTDIVLLLVDSSEGTLVDQEIKLAFYAFTEQYKAVILLFNKQDLVDEDTKAQLEFSLSEYKFFLKKIESLNISCKTDKNIGKIMPLVKKVWKRYSTEFPKEELDILFKEALEKKPLFHKTIPLRLYSTEQIRTAPITIILKVNYPEWFGSSQVSFFENILRKKYDLKGVPIKFLVRKNIPKSSKK